MVRASIRRFLTSPLVDGVLRFAVVLSVIGSGFAIAKNRELAQCVARYNDASNDRSVILTQATDDERAAERKADDAQADLFLSPALSKPGETLTPADRAEVLRLFRAYQAALSDQKQERKAADDARRVHPIPDPPKDVCG